MSYGIINEILDLYNTHQFACIRLHPPPPSPLPGPRSPPHSRAPLLHTTLQASPEPGVRRNDAHARRIVQHKIRILVLIVRIARRAQRDILQPPTRLALLFNPRRRIPQRRLARESRESARGVGERLEGRAVGVWLRFEGVRGVFRLAFRAGAFRCGGRGRENEGEEGPC